MPISSHRRPLWASARVNSPDELGRRIGVVPSAARALLVGNSAVSATRAVRIEEVLELSARDLLHLQADVLLDQAHEARRQSGAGQ